MSIMTKLGIDKTDVVFCREREASYLVDWDTLHMMYENTKRIIYVGNYLMDRDYEYYACFNAYPSYPRDKKAIHIAVKI